MREIPLTENQRATEEPNILVENDANNRLFSTDKSNDSLVNDDINEVEEDMELLDLKDGEFSNSMLLKLASNKLQLPDSSPQLASKNRRYTLRPKKRPETTECDKFTTTSNKRKKSVSLKSGSLETIFENPVLRNGSQVLWGKSKLKRYLSFNSFVSKAKLKQKKLKLKRLAKGKRKKSNIKLTIEDVKLKLNELEDEEGEWMDLNE